MSREQPKPAMTGRDIALRLLEIINRSEWDSLGEVLADDVVIEWRQSGERIRGLANARSVFSSYPGEQPDRFGNELEFVEGDEDRFIITPSFTMIRAEGVGDSVTSTVRTIYPDGAVWYIVNLAKLRSGKIVYMVQYFAPAYDAPDWRAQWVEPM